MKLLTLQECRTLLEAKYGELARTYPSHFARLVPRDAREEQLSMVCGLIAMLTGQECPPGLAQIVQSWDLDALEIAGFSFGASDTFPARLLQWNKQPTSNAWWEDAFEQRPLSLLRIAQGDPYVLLVDVSTDHVLAYEAGAGVRYAHKVAGDLPTCLRGMVSLQMRGPTATEDEVTAIETDLGGDVDMAFWQSQWRRWLPR